MTRAELIVDLKNRIGPSPATDNNGLASWINEAYFYMVDEIQKVNPDYFTKSATTSSVDGQQEYDLPDDYDKILMVEIQIDGVWHRARPIPNIGFVPNHADTSNSQGYPFSFSDPRYYIVGDNIGFLPIPDETTSNNIKVWYVYTPDELDEDGDEPAFSKKYHRVINMLAYANYLDQDDEHVAAEKMRQRFEARVAAMVESLSDQQVDEPKSVAIVQNKDLYADDGRYL